MIIARTWDEAKPARRENNKATFRGFVTDFIEAQPGVEPQAQAYLVEQEPEWVLPVHFHLQHQFQVFTAGNGTMGRRAVAPLCMHYASAESGYGPIVAGPAGVAYLTLRVASDTGAWYLPESRPHMQPGLPKKQAHGQPATRVSDEALRALDRPQVEALIASEPSGLATHLVRMGAGQVVPASAFGHTGDRFYVVTRGTMRLGGNDVTGLATIFASRDDSLDIESGKDALEVMVLQFPDEARYGAAQPAQG